MVRSTLPESRRRPSGDRARHSTAWVCPSRTRQLGAGRGRRRVVAAGLARPAGLRHRRGDGRGVVFRFPLKAQTRPPTRRATASRETAATVPHRAAGLRKNPPAFFSRCAGRAGRRASRSGRRGAGSAVTPSGAAFGAAASLAEGRTGGCGLRRLHGGGRLARRLGGRLRGAAAVGVLRAGRRRRQPRRQRLGHLGRRLVAARPGPSPSSCATTAASPSGTSGRRRGSARGCGIWCQISFWATVPSVERRLAGQQEVERRAQAVDVGADVDVVAVEGLLRGEVVGRAEDALVVVLACVRLSSSSWKKRARPMSRILTTPCAVQQQVARLDVAVDQPGLVGVLQAQRRLADVVGGRGRRPAARPS